MRVKLNSKLLVILYLGLLLLGSVVPIGNWSSDILMDNYTLDIRWDYLLHAIIYLPLPLILFNGLRRMNSSATIWIVTISMLIPVLFEVLQMLIPYRSFNINDLIANFMGVILGYLVLLSFKKRLLLKQRVP